MIPRVDGDDVVVVRAVVTVLLLKERVGRGGVESKARDAA